MRAAWRRYRRRVALERELWERAKEADVQRMLTEVSAGTYHLRPRANTAASPIQRLALDSALAEEYGELIIRLFAMPPAELEALMEACQLIDTEAQEILEAYDRDSKQARTPA